MSRRFAALVLTAALGVGAGCAPRRVTRSEVVDNYRRGLVGKGVHADQARCLTDKFFAELTDDQLREFQKRDRLTEAEQQRFAQLAEECPDTGA